MHGPEAMRRSPDTPRPRQRSTEYGGVGQSGYTAGRREDDPSLEAELEVRNRSYPAGYQHEADPSVPDLGIDDRWTGRGGTEPEVEAPPAARA